MLPLTLIGVDPGIVDTAATAISLDFEKREIAVATHVWSNVTRQENFKILVRQGFLTELRAWTEDYSGIVVRGVEGYRQRGKNQKQDQNMIYLVQKIEEALPGNPQIVDNASMKKIVKEKLLEMFHCKRFPGTNHADSKSAARVALRLGISNELTNKLLSEYVRDHLDGNPWRLRS
jgi:hypothetical protein